MTIKRPNLRSVCAVFESLNYSGQPLYLKLNESGGFEILRSMEDGAVLIQGGNTRKAVRRALDQAEKNLHDRRKEYSTISKEAE